MDADRLLDGRLKIRHLVLVTTIADEGAVVRAADRLGVTQPVVTRGLRELESILHVQLFERGPRGVTLTTFGAVFVEEARAVLTRLRAAARHVDELVKAEIGTVNVGIHLAGSRLLSQAIVALKREHPTLTVVVREATQDVLYRALQSGEIDLKVGRLTHPAEAVNLVAEQLYREPVRITTRAGHPILSQSPDKLLDVVDHTWIFPVEQTALRCELEDAFARENLPLPVNRVECSSLPIIRNLLVSSDMITALPMMIGSVDDQLAIAPLPLALLRRSIGVVLPADRPVTPGVQALLTHLRVEAAAVGADLGDER